MFRSYRFSTIDVPATAQAGRSSLIQNCFVTHRNFHKTNAFFCSIPKPVPKLCFDRFKLICTEKWIQRTLAITVIYYFRMRSFVPSNRPNKYFFHIDKKDQIRTVPWQTVLFIPYGSHTLHNIHRSFLLLSVSFRIFCHTNLPAGYLSF